MTAFQVDDRMTTVKPTPPFLVTGAGGFLGRALALRLAKELGHTRVLLRQPQQAHGFEGLAVECVIGELENIDTMRRAMKDIGTVFHCAAKSTDWGDWESYYTSNVQGVTTLLQAAQECSLTRLVHISTTDVYGYPKAACAESAPMKDVGLPYNRSKILGESLVWEASRTGALPVTVIRPATIYGPGSNDFVTTVADMLGRRQMLLIDGGKACAGLLYIDNAVDAIIAASAAATTVGEAYNLRDTSAETWHQYVYALAAALGLEPPRINMPYFAAYGMAAALENVHSLLGLVSKPLLTRHAVYLMARDAGFPITKAQQAFGFHSRVRFADAVQRCAEWYGQLASTDKTTVNLAARR